MQKTMPLRTPGQAIPILAFHEEFLNIYSELNASTIKQGKLCSRRKYGK